MLEEIFKIHQAGQLDEAEQRYREWLTFNPDDPEALHLLAILRRQRDDLPEAIGLARKAVDLVPDRANYQLTLAGLWLHAREYDRAREGFTTALRVNPNLPGAALGIAQVALLQQDLPAAQDALAKAERMAPEHPQVFAQKAGLARARGDHDTAVKLYLEAAKRNPNDPGFQANLAQSFAALGKTAFAEQALRNAVQLKPNYTVARVALAQLLLKERRVDEAQAEFEHILGEQPAHPLALAGRGDIHRVKGDLAAALEDYRQAHAGAPTVSSIAKARVETLLATGAGDEARAVLADALQRTPASAMLRHLDLALAIREPGDRYLTACRAWVEADPASMEAQERLAYALELRGDYDEANALCREVLARNSRAGFARLILARSALREDRPEDAHEQLNRVPDATLSQARRIERAQLRGLTRDRLGDYAGAVDAWLNTHRIQQNLAPLTLMPDPAKLDADLPASPAATADSSPAPTFLIGLPGAGTESLVALLRKLDIRVLSDRFGQRMRGDALATGEFATMANQLAGDPGQADAFRDRYLAGLAAIDQAIDASLVDWLPYADLRAVALILAAFPNARFILVERDPRDALLTWLALGTPQSLRFESAEKAGEWMARAHAHLDVARIRIGPERLLILPSAELDSPTAIPSRLSSFLTVAPATESPAALDGLRLGRGGLSTTVPDGRWSDYAAPLAPALTHLDAPVPAGTGDAR